MRRRVNWDDERDLREYRDRIMMALENSDYLSPVAAYQNELRNINARLNELKVAPRAN